MEQWHNRKLHYIPKCSTRYKVVKVGLFIPQTFSTQFPEYPSPAHMQRVYSGFLVIFTALPSTSRICLRDHASHATSEAPVYLRDSALTCEHPRCAVFSASREASRHVLVALEVLSFRIEVRW